MNLKKLVEDYTLTQNALPDDDIVEISVHEYHPYYPGIPIGDSAGPIEFIMHEERKRRAKALWDSNGMNCPHCNEPIGFKLNVERVLFRFKMEQKAGTCPHCKTILYDFRTQTNNPYDWKLTEGG